MTAPIVTTTPRRRPPVHWTDWAPIALAVVSLVLITWMTFVRLPRPLYITVLWIDGAICVVFLLDFLARWRAEHWSRKFLLLHWYELLGMVPAFVVTMALPHAFKFLRIVLVVARLASAIDRAYGDRVTAVIVARATDTVVDAVKRPITIAVLDEVAEVLKTGHYTKNIAAALEENKPEMSGMILETIKNDPQTKSVKYIPFHDEIIQLIVDTTFRMVLQVLADQRTDELVSDMLRENIDQIRDSVKRKEAAAGNTAVTPPPAP
ncbi:ion transporter [Tsukamurella sputi]|uniref:Ion transporter n=1 Tax=Tsukamurella sputi TaxID=2591848 RepID=A0A5C5RSZ7_9ACTN|nr:ion transporter [Tsukamurella sputi]TWS25155.1 ion transporter [Tsukamurella sputi]